MQAFPSDFLVRKFFGRSAQKCSETVYLRKISSPGRKSGGKASILRGGLRQNTLEKRDLERYFNERLQFLEQNYGQQVRRKYCFFDISLLMVIA